jgi:hypothetical protein
MEKKMKLTSRHVYGRYVFYPDCETSQFICDLLKKTTINQDEITLAKKHGFKVETRVLTPEEVKGNKNNAK